MMSAILQSHQINSTVFDILLMLLNNQRILKSDEISGTVFDILLMSLNNQRHP